MPDRLKKENDRFCLKLLRSELLKLTHSKSWLIALKCFLICIWCGVVLFCFLHRESVSIDGILKYTPNSPLLATVMILILFAIKSISIVIYCGILYAVNGILFPLPYAILLNICGTAIMVSVPYWIGKTTGSQVAQRITEKHPKATILKDMRSKNDFLFSFLTRIIGVLPSDIVSLYMGAIQVNYWKYLFGCLLGFLPSTITFPLMGMNITNVRSPEFLISLCIELLFMIVSAVVCLIYRKKHINNR